MTRKSPSAESYRGLMIRMRDYYPEKPLPMLKDGLPRHSQITEWLRNKIKDGDYGIEEKLPSENELASKFGVSRVTVRRALQSLENESLIYRCQGLGSFVNDRRASHNLVRLTDFNEDMAKAGLDASSKVINFDSVASPAWLAKLLGMEEGTKVLQIDRLRLGDGEPVAYDITWLPLFYGQLLNPSDLENSTIYKILEKQCKIPVHRGCYRITADAANKNLAKQLQVKEHTPLLLINRLSYTVASKPVYYQKRYYRSDKVSYEMTLERSADDKQHSESLPLKEFIPVFHSS